jgi:hypothetical protein
MSCLHSFLVSAAILAAPVSIPAAFAQSEPASQAPATSAHATTHSATTSGVVGASSADVVPPAKNGPGDTAMVRKASPDSPSAQLQNPTGAEPGTGSGMGKVSGTAAGN